MILGDQEIETVEKFTYLGGLISEPRPGGVTRPAILQQVQKARLTLDGLAGVFRQQGLGLKGRELLVKSVVIPILLQGAETWATSAADLNSIDRVLGRARRLICRSGTLGTSNWWNRFPGPPRNVRVLRGNAQRLITERRLTFTASLAAGGNCKIAEEILWSRIPEERAKRTGGRCQSKSGKA